MSQPGKKGPGKGAKAKPVVDDAAASERATPASKADGDGKDETSSNGDKKDPKTTDEPAPSKPQSAGASVRDAANKLLVLAMKGEWTPVDQAIKSLEKYVANAGEDGNHVPLAGVMDPTTGMTPLMYAAKDNRTGLLDRMIEIGADVGARNNDNYNVLHIAAMYSREDVVKLLLNKRGIDPFSTGGSRAQTAVHLVSSRQTGTATQILRVLLAAAGKDIRLKADGIVPTKNATKESNNGLEHTAGTYFEILISFVEIIYSRLF